MSTARATTQLAVVGEGVERWIWGGVDIFDQDEIEKAAPFVLQTEDWIPDNVQSSGSIVISSTGTAPSQTLDFKLDQRQAPLLFGEWELSFRVGFGGQTTAASGGEYLVDNAAAHMIDRIEIVYGGDQRVKWLCYGWLQAEIAKTLPENERQVWQRMAGGGFGGNTGRYSVLQRQEWASQASASGRYLRLRILRHPFEGRSNPLPIIALNQDIIVRVHFNNVNRFLDTTNTRADVYLSDFLFQTEGLYLLQAERDKWVRHAWDSDSHRVKATHWELFEHTIRGTDGSYGPTDVREIEPLHLRNASYVYQADVRYAPLVTYQSATLGLDPEERIPIESLTVRISQQDIMPTFSSRPSSSFTSAPTQSGGTKAISYWSFWNQAQKAFPYSVPGDKVLTLPVCVPDDTEANHRQFYGGHSMEKLYKPMIRLQLPLNADTASDDPALYRFCGTADANLIFRMWGWVHQLHKFGPVGRWETQVHV